MAQSDQVLPELKLRLNAAEERVRELRSEMADLARTVHRHQAIVVVVGAIAVFLGYWNNQLSDEMAGWQRQVEEGKIQIDSHVRTSIESLDPKIDEANRRFQEKISSQQVQMVSGTVTQNGGIEHGDGFTVDWAAPGRYTISFKESFESFPSVIANPAIGLPGNPTGNGVTTIIVKPGTHSCVILTLDSGKPRDGAFSFIATAKTR